MDMSYFGAIVYNVSMPYVCSYTILSIGIPPFKQLLNYVANKSNDKRK